MFTLSLNVFLCLNACGLYNACMSARRVDFGHPCTMARRTMDILGALAQTRCTMDLGSSH
jgi:hypothetical protein